MALDGLILNGTNINDETNYVLQTIDFTPPKKKPEWAQSADADGSALIRTPLFENRVITATLQVAPQASKNAALEKLGTIVDLLQEAEKNPEGIPLEWTPASSSKTITFYVLTAEVTSIPMSNEGLGATYYFGNAPVFVVQFTCKPFGYGAEVEAAAAKSIETGLSVVTLTVPTVAGDVPAEGRLVVKDTATVGRRFVEWGLENRYYDAATKLVLDSEDMTPVGGTQSTVIGTPPAYKRAGATKWTIATSLFPEPTICANTGVLKHVGTYRVKARAWLSLVSGGFASSTGVRFSYQDGEGPFRANTWQQAPLGNTFVELDLGIVTLTPAITGIQKWLGQVEAYSGNVGAPDILYLDYLTFIPVAEGYGKARGVQSTAPGTIVAFDNFTTGTLSGALNARTPAAGAAWATSGSATDWAVGSGKVSRSTVSDAEPRFGIVGAALGNMSVASAMTTAAITTGAVTLGVITRWVNSTNYAFLLCELVKGQATITLGVKVAGVTTVANSLVQPQPSSETGSFTNFAATLAALTDGSLIASGSVGGAQTFNFTLAGSHSSVATGGALISGKGGIYDFHGSTGTPTRTVTSINVAQLSAVPYCIQPSRTMEVRSDSAITADGTGTYFGPVPQYRGSRFFVPQDGSANRTSRILVKADRNDLEVSDELTIADAFTAQIFATPRFHVIPR